MIQIFLLISPKFSKVSVRYRKVKGRSTGYGSNKEFIIEDHEDFIETFKDLIENPYKYLKNEQYLYYAKDIIKEKTSEVLLDIKVYEGNYIVKHDTFSLKRT